MAILNQAQTGKARTHLRERGITVNRVVANNTNDNDIKNLAAQAISTLGQVDTQYEVAGSRPDI